MVLFFYSPVRVARGQVHSSQGKSLMPAMNDVKMEQHGKREVNDILYKKNGHLTKDRDGISIFKEPGFQRPELSKHIERRLEVITESDSQYSAPRLEPHFGH